MRIAELRKLYRELESYDNFILLVLEHKSIGHCMDYYSGKVSAEVFAEKQAILAIIERIFNKRNFDRLSDKEVLELYTIWLDNDKDLSRGW